MQETLAEGPVDAAKRLDFYYGPTRSPDAFPEGSASEHFTPADVALALAALREVIPWAQTRLPEPTSGPSRTWAKRVDDAFCPTSVVLCGSYARGTYRQSQSDVVVLVLGPLRPRGHRG